MDIIEIIVHKVGYLAYTLPSAFAVLFVKESSRISLTKRLGNYHDKSIYFNPFSSIDPLALFCLSLTNASWGGFVQKNRKDHWLGFLISELSLLILMVIIMAYLQIKNPGENSYLYSFCHSIIEQSWFVFIMNALPLPPFDMSFFYMQKPYMRFIQFVSKGAVLTVLIAGWFEVKKFIPYFLN